MRIAGSVDLKETLRELASLPGRCSALTRPPPKPRRSSD